MKGEYSKIILQSGEKEEIIRRQEAEIQGLNEHIETLKKNVNIYSDRELTDFGPRSNSFTNNMGNNKLNTSSYSTKEREQATFMRELEHIKKSLKMLQEENEILNNELSQKDQKIKLIE